MPDQPDPVLVAHSAGVAREYAVALRARAARLGSSAEDSEWAGPAARAFRVETSEVVARLQAAARRLDDAADRLELHAAALRVEAAETARRQAEELRRIRHGSDAINGYR